MGRSRRGCWGAATKLARRARYGWLAVGLLTGAGVGLLAAPPALGQGCSNVPPGSYCVNWLQGPGSNQTTLSIDNQLSDSISSFTFQLPSGTTVTGASDGCTVDGNEISCPNPIPSGGSASVVITTQDPLATNSNGTLTTYDSYNPDGTTSSAQLGGAPPSGTGTGTGTGTGSGTPTTGTSPSPSCSQPPSQLQNGYQSDLTASELKGWEQYDVKDLTKAIDAHDDPGIDLAQVRQALKQELRAEPGVPSPDLKGLLVPLTPASEFLSTTVGPPVITTTVGPPVISSAADAHAAGIAISKDDLDSCLDGLTEYTNEFTESRGIKGKPADDVKRLVAQLAILKDLLDPDKNKDVKPEDKKKILENALVSLVKEFGGVKAGELTGHGATLFKLISGQLSKKDQDKAFKDAVGELAKKLVGKDGGDLAAQIFTLVDVLQGNIDPEKSATILQQSIVGLVTRLGGKGLLNMPQIRAFITGYQLLAPFADNIVKNLVVVVNRSVYTRCLTELEAAAPSSGVEYPGPGIRTNPWKGNPVATEGWSCSSYNDPDTGKLTIQAVSSSGGWVILYDFNTGETIGQRGGP